ncbi:MAG: alcohol dehydrogenase catalytic domain-containing protein [Oscillospiraceae bacterium]|nr:alcohol dehydrogenase catalytic domain-containing protein [Oscillospiraceae bacterium]
MKAIRFLRPEVIEYSEIPLPQVKDNEVLAKIAYAGFCATDIELLTGEMVHIKNGNTTYPIIPGHEWSGTIVAVGSHVHGFAVGDRVTSDVSLGCGECEACRQGHYNLCPNREVIGSYRNRQGVFAQYVAVPQRHLYKIPDGLTLEQAALAEPAATAAYAVTKAQIPAGAQVLVIGDGPIGQLAAQLANLAGASRVILAGSWDEKLEIAKQCGIADTINYHREDVAQRAAELTHGGPEIIIETSGNNSALDSAVRALKPTGRIVAVSWYNGATLEVAMNTLIVKDAALIGSLASPNSFEPVLRYMAAGKLNVQPLITHVMPMEQLADVVKLVREKKEMRIKILLKPE